LLHRSLVGPRRQTLRALVSAVDAVTVFVTVLVAGETAHFLDDWLNLPFVGFGSRAVVATMTLIWCFALELVEAHDPSIVMAGTDYYTRAFRGTFWAFSGLALIGFALDVRAARPYIVVGLPLGLVTLTLTKWFTRQIVRRMAAIDPQGPLVDRVVTVSGPHRDQVLTRIQSQNAPYLLNVGVLQSTDVQDIATYALLRKASVVLLDRDHELSSQQVESLGWALDLSSIALYLEADAGFLRPGKTILIPHPAMTLLNIKTVHLSAAQRFLKRGFDLVLGSILLLLSLPLILAASVMVVMDGGFPAFYRQERVGRDGRLFAIRKIRTMASALDSRQASPVPTLANRMKDPEDPRRTRMGRILRRWSIDELPQLVNVLGGSMSLVGPRPRLPDEPHNTTHSARRLRARPGLTGLWQVSGRANMSFAQADLLDVEYVDNWSLLGDISILFRTLKVVIRGDGAY
jgi:lipopolysaccharide/colanic/teichoic acid biosynthesis glycosyltransferase